METLFTDKLLDRSIITAGYMRVSIGADGLHVENFNPNFTPPWGPPWHDYKGEGKVPQVDWSL